MFTTANIIALHDLTQHLTLTKVVPIDFGNTAAVMEKAATKAAVEPRASVIRRRNDNEINQSWSITKSSILKHKQMNYQSRLPNIISFWLHYQCTKHYVHVVSLGVSFLWIESSTFVWISFFYDGTPTPWFIERCSTPT